MWYDDEYMDYGPEDWETELECDPDYDYGGTCEPDQLDDFYDDFNDD